MAFLRLSWTSSASAKAKDEEQKENDRMQNAGTVIKEILDVPDDIPQDLIDKARCVIVFPSVLKAAFIVGGSYGRGVMVCRTQRFFRPLGRAGDDGFGRRQLRLADRWPSNRFRNLGDEQSRCRQPASQQS